ncbi:MAG: glutathione S-transferase family protein [Gammaproteobacteria bacterium]|nr:glutathione S-transferase family protein [Gammaproteobacteria bacterium]
MKLYMHPVSTTSRPILLLIAEYKLDIEPVVVDLFAGEHMGQDYAGKNPNMLVPLIEDGDFRLSECSAILKYLADRFELPCYPADLEQRAKVNECMDWFNTQFSREYGYGLVYPQLFPHHHRENEDVQKATIAWGKERAERWLTILDRDIIGAEKPYLCGDDITIADFFAAGHVTLGELARCNFSAYPNVCRWLGNMKQLESWDSVHQEFYGLAEQLKDKPFEAIGA